MVPAQSRFLLGMPWQCHSLLTSWRRFQSVCLHKCKAQWSFLEGLRAFQDSCKSLLSSVQVTCRVHVHVCVLLISSQVMKFQTVATYIESCSCCKHPFCNSRSMACLPVPAFGLNHVHDLVGILCVMVWIKLTHVECFCCHGEIDLGDADRAEPCCFITITFQRATTVLKHKARLLVAKTPWFIFKLN